MDSKKYWIVIILITVVVLIILFLNHYEVVAVTDIQETHEAPLDTVDPYEQMLEVARTEQNPEIAKLYYLNIINNNPNKTNIFQEYLDYLHSIDASEQEYRELASFTYLAIMQASPKILQSLFGVYQSIENTINNQFILDDTSPTTDEVESQALVTEFSNSIQEILSLENAKEFDFGEFYNSYNEVLYLYQLLQNPTKEQENQLLEIRNVFEILQTQGMLLAQITDSIRYEDEAFSEAYTFIMQQHEYLRNTIAEFSLVKHPFQNTIEERNQVLQNEIKIIKSRYLNLQIGIIEMRKKTLKNILADANLSNSEKAEHLQNFKIFIQQRQSLLSEEMFFKAIEESSALYLNELKTIEQNRLQAYQLWVYQAIVATETLLDNQNKKTDFNTLAYQINETGFFTINSDNLISQMFSLYENTYKSLMKVYKDPEDKKIIESWIEINLRNGYKTLEDF